MRKPPGLDTGHHNAHVNDEERGFDDCYPVVVHAESREEAREIAQVLMDEFGVEESAEVPADE